MPAAGVVSVNPLSGRDLESVRVRPQPSCRSATVSLADQIVHKTISMLRPSRCRTSPSVI